MHETKLSLGKIIVGVICLLVIIGGIAYQATESSKPVVLDVAYLNKDLLLVDKDLVDMVGKVELADDIVICLCTTTDNHLLVAYLERKGNGYSCLENATFSTPLPESQYTYIDITPISFSSSHKDKKFYLSVFLNPQDDSIMINGQSVPIQTINFTMGKKDYFIGFWCTSLAKESVLEFE